MFSILTANYNNGKYFKDCFESIIHQTYQDFEVIIVDDCSTDNSVEIISKIIENDKRFKLFHNEKNGGEGYTKRRCADFAIGEIYGYLDPDDTLRIDALEIMVKLHQVYTECSIINSRFNNMDLDLNFVSLGTNGEAIPKGKSYLTYDKNAITAFATFKKTAYEKTAGINPGLRKVADQDLYYKLEEVGEHYFYNDYLYNYRRLSNSLSSNLKKAQYWHTKVVIDTYNRRKRNKLEIDNLEPSFFKKKLHNFYLQQAVIATAQNKICSKLFLLLKASWLKPFFGLRTKFRILFNLKTEYTLTN
jgi:glycosyltransferase involved in cell wall biosynthesis